MARRAFIVVLDAVGAGELPDAAAFGDEGSNTLAHVAEAVGGLRPAEPAGARARQRACRSRAARPWRRLPRSPAGCSSARRARTRPSATGSSRASSRSAPFPTYPRRLPAGSARRVRAGDGARRDRQRRRLGHRDHRAARRGAPAHRGSGSSTRRPTRVFQIAAHEATVPLEELYAACRTARGCSRRARRRARDRPPVRGRARRVPPHAEPARLLARAAAPELPHAHPRGRRHACTGVGKIGDIFAGLRRRRVAADDVERGRASRARSSSAHAAADRGLVFVNLVETDMTYGHRNDPRGLHRCLQEIDAAIPDLLARSARRPAAADLGSRLRPDDALDRSFARVRAAGRARARAPHGRGATTASSPTWARPCAAWLGAASATPACRAPRSL